MGCVKTAYYGAETCGIDPGTPHRVTLFSGHGAEFSRVLRAADDAVALDCAVMDCSAEIARDRIDRRLEQHHLAIGGNNYAYRSYGGWQFGIDSSPPFAGVFTRQGHRRRAYGSHHAKEKDENEGNLPRCRTNTVRHLALTLSLFEAEREEDSRSSSFQRAQRFEFHQPVVRLGRRSEIVSGPLLTASNAKTDQNRQFQFCAVETGFTGLTRFVPA